MTEKKQEPESWRRVRAIVRTLGEATRPQLAAATGLSQVQVGKIVESMCMAGELKARGRVASGGGRPAEVYGYRYAPAAIFIAQREGSLLSGRLELLDERGNVHHTQQAHFAILHGQSLDDWLDAAACRPLGSIVLDVPPDISTGELEHHLKQRYGCPVQRITAAMVLAVTQDAAPQEGTVTLALPMGREPSACIRRGSTYQSCGRLGLLPQPALWEELDYEDHTLLEEMVARLLLMLTCTLAPTNISLHAAFWTERLTGRIRYNLSTKLKGTSPPRLNFRSITTTELDQLRHRYSLRHER